MITIFLCFILLLILYITFNLINTYIERSKKIRAEEQIAYEAFVNMVDLYYERGRSSNFNFITTPKKKVNHKELLLSKLRNK